MKIEDLPEKFTQAGIDSRQLCHLRWVLKPLLDEIGKHESDSAASHQGVESGYDVVYGGIKPYDRPQNDLVVGSNCLTNLFVGQVREWQDSINRDYPSEASGRYQIIRQTLRDLVNHGIIRDDLEFDEIGQDLIAIILLNRRGLKRFLVGELSAVDFANNLAKEWASFPVQNGQEGRFQFVHRGQSYYFSGKGSLNKAHAKPEKVMAALEHVKKRIGEEPIGDQPQATASKETALEDRVTRLEGMIKVLMENAVSGIEIKRFKGGEDG